MATAVASAVDDSKVLVESDKKQQHQHRSPFRHFFQKRNKTAETAAQTPASSPAAQDVTAALAFEEPPKGSKTENDEEEEQQGAETPLSDPPALERKALPDDETTSVTKKKHKHLHKDHSNWITRTKTFKDICDKAFDMIDTDNSGDVDEKELYSGLLLIHLKLGCFAGPAACRPLGRDRCHKVFVEYDDNEQGVLSREEFQNVMVLLFSNVVLRVLVQWSMTLLIVPLIARHTLEAWYAAWFFIYECIVNADEYSEIANQIELTLEAVAAYIWNQVLPTTVVHMCQAFVRAWNAVPDSVWNAAPLSLLSTLLGVLVVPWLILQVDDFFQYLSETGAEKMREEEEQEENNNKKNETTTAADADDVETKKTQ